VSLPFATLGGVVLAAGASARLGQPKQLLEWRGKALVCHAFEACQPVCGAGVAVVTGANAKEVEALLADYAAVVVRNPDWSAGMSASLRHGLAALQLDALSGVLVTLCDQPLVSGPDLIRLVQCWQANPEQPAAAYYQGLRGVPAIFPARMFAALGALTADKGARSLLRNCADCGEVALPAAAIDIDTPADIEQLHAAVLAQARRPDDQ